MAKAVLTTECYPPSDGFAVNQDKRGVEQQIFGVRSIGDNSKIMIVSIKIVKASLAIMLRGEEYRRVVNIIHSAATESVL
jgi:hypothetical protein